MGIDRPSRGSEDDDRRRRPERGELDKAAEAVRARRNSMSGTERRQAIRDEHARLKAEEEAKKEGSTGADDGSPDRPRSRHERELADGPRRHETEEQADARIEARERAEHQNMSVAEALARADEEEGPDDDFPALSRGDTPYAPPGKHGGEQADRPKGETTDGPQTRIEAAKGELRAALDSGDDERLRRATDAMSSALDVDKTSTSDQADQASDRPRVDWDRDENPYSPLGNPRTAHDAVIPETDREQFTKDAVDRTTEILGRRPINAEYAGRVFYDKWPGPMKEKYPNGIPFSHEGFPEFAAQAKAAVTLEEGFGPTRQRDFARAKEQWERTTGEVLETKGYTWHHHEDGRTLLLVPRDVHRATGHSGGWAIAGKLGTRRSEDA